MTDDWQILIGFALLSKGILLAYVLYDIAAAMELFNHAIALLEAEEQLSNSANEVLHDLKKERNKLMGIAEPINSKPIMKQIFDNVLHTLRKKCRTWWREISKRI